MRRLVALAAVAVASFASAAVAVAYFADTRETYDVVRAGPPIPWLKAWSQATDPSGTLTYATRNGITPATPAATGRIDATTETLTVDLGRREAGNIPWKRTATANADVNNRFNRLFTVGVPADAPLAAGQRVTIALSQEGTVPTLSTPHLFRSLELAAIDRTATAELTSAFRGTGFAATVQLGAGEQRQVNVEMENFGQTDSQSGRITTTAVVVTATLPDGGEVAHRVPVTVCNHVQQC